MDKQTTKSRILSHGFMGDSYEKVLNDILDTVEELKDDE